MNVLHFDALSGTLLATIPRELQLNIQYYARPKIGALKDSYKFLFSFGGKGMLESNMACPWGVTTTVKNQYIVVDHTLNNIKVFGPKGNLIRTFGSVGKNDGQLNGPIGVSSDADCNIYVADFSNQRYDVFDINGNFLSKNGRSGSLDGEFSNPWGIAIDPNNQDIVVADASNCRIQVFDKTGKFKTKFGHGMLSSPADVAVDLEGRILIADRGNNVVQIYTKEGKHLLKFPSEKTSLGGIWSLTVSADGSIIVADYANHEVKVYSGDGKLKFSFGENGKGDGQFDHPINVAIDQEGNIIVVDNLNARVHVWG